MQRMRATPSPLPPQPRAATSTESRTSQHPSAAGMVIGMGSRRPTRSALETMVNNMANELSATNNKLQNAEKELAELAILEDQQKGSLPNTECIVCMNATVSTVLIPCGHLCLCVACAALLQANKRNCNGCGSGGDHIVCPLCRLPVQQMHRVFLPVDEAAVDKARAKITRAAPEAQTVPLPAPSPAPAPSALTPATEVPQSPEHGDEAHTAPAVVGAMAVAMARVEAGSLPTDSGVQVSPRLMRSPTAPEFATPTVAVTEGLQTASAHDGQQHPRQLQAHEERPLVVSRRVCDLVRSLDGKLEDVDSSDDLMRNVAAALPNAEPRVLQARMLPGANAAGALQRRPPPQQRRALLGEQTPGAFDFTLPGAWEPRRDLAATWS